LTEFAFGFYDSHGWAHLSGNENEMTTNPRNTQYDYSIGMALRLIPRILNNEVDFVDGLRNLMGLNLPDHIRDKEPFLCICGFESEMDGFPSSSYHSRWNLTFPDDFMQRFHGYMERVGPIVREALVELLPVLENELPPQNDTE
jgi:hypothetical protein